MRTFRFLLLTACCAFAGQMTTPNGSGFANACAGYGSFGSLPNPGDGFSTTTNSFQNCMTQNAGFANASTSYSGVYNGYVFDFSHSVYWAGPARWSMNKAFTARVSRSLPFPGSVTIRHSSPSLRHPCYWDSGCSLCGSSGG